MGFSDILQKLLRERKITAYKLSQSLNVSQSIISHWKKGTKVPSAQNLQRIADFFGVSMDYLMTGRDSQKVDLQCDPEEAQLREKLSHYGFALQSLNRDIHDLTLPEMQDVAAVIDFLKAKRLLKDNEHSRGDKKDGKS